MHFQVLHDANVDEVSQELVTMKIDASKEPLWAARLLPWCPKHDRFIRMTSTPDDKPKFPNVYHFVIGSFHAINDGFSNSFMNKVLLEMLTDILSGEEVDDTRPLGSLYCPEKEFEEQRKMEMHFVNNPDLLQERKKHFGNILSNTLINRDFVPPPESKPKTITLVHVFSKEQSKVFRYRCKKENISLHSGISTLIDAAIVNSLINKGFNQPFYKISSSHAVDMRRYFPTTELEFGLGQRPLYFARGVTEYVVSKFWTEALQHHAIFKSEYQKKAPLQLDVVNKLTNTNGLPTSKEGATSFENKLYYSLSNAGDNSSIITNYGDHIQMEYMDGTTDMTASNYLSMFLCFFFKGKIHCSFQYNSNMLSDHTAEEIKNNLADVMARILD